MSRMAIFGLVLIVVGVLMLIFPAISYVDRDRVADIGPLEVDVENTETIPIPPVLGGIAVAAGVVMLVAGRRPGAGGA